MSNQLAVFGAKPIRERPWPKWPIGTPESQRSLLEVLHSGKWAISGWSHATNTYERRTSRAFAEFTSRKYCVACSHGSAALFLALQSIGVGPGDEVVLTGLTWVACPTAVVRLGAKPILVDIGPNDLCAPASNIERAITPKTRAILMIHMYSSICNIDEYVELAQRKNIVLIEDASQAHGASWHGMRIGKFGTISIFSTQQSKLLTSGEGGLCVTDDVGIYSKLQQLRADGRKYRIDPFIAEDSDLVIRRESHEDAKEKSPLDGYELQAAGDFHGQNLCLSEFQSALLLEGLGRLDQENQHRLSCVNTLKEELKKIDFAELLLPCDAVDRPTFYRLAIRLNRSAFGGLTAQHLAPALAAELNADIKRVDAPLSAHPLYVPTKPEGFARAVFKKNSLDPQQFQLPMAQKAYLGTVTLPHQMLLSAPEDMQDIAEALQKLQRLSSTIKEKQHALTAPQDV